MNLLKRRYENPLYERKNEEKTKEELKKLKNSGLRGKDIIAIIIATFQIVLPFAIGIVIVYFFIILFITKLWMN